MLCHDYYLLENKMLAFRHQREGISLFSPHIFTIILNHTDFFFGISFSAAQSTMRKLNGQQVVFQARNPDFTSFNSRRY
jgi:hypothetical protein